MNLVVDGERELLSPIRSHWVTSGSNWPHADFLIGPSASHSKQKNWPLSNSWSSLVCKESSQSRRKSCRRDDSTHLLIHYETQIETLEYSWSTYYIRSYILCVWTHYQLDVEEPHPCPLWKPLFLLRHYIHSWLCLCSFFVASTSSFHVFSSSVSFAWPPG